MWAKTGPCTIKLWASSRNQLFNYQKRHTFTAASASRLSRDSHHQERLQSTSRPDRARQIGPIIYKVRQHHSRMSRCSCAVRQTKVSAAWLRLLICGGRQPSHINLTLYSFHPSEDKDLGQHDSPFSLLPDTCRRSNKQPIKPAKSSRRREAFRSMLSHWCADASARQVFRA